MAEHLFCKQAVAGSNPIAGSILLLLTLRGDRLTRNAAHNSVAGHEGFYCPMV